MNEDHPDSANRDLASAARERVADLHRLQALGLVPRSGTFFPSVHYPPVTMVPPSDEQAFLRGWTNPPDGRFVVYVHIPFCPTRCSFCHYPVTVSDDESKHEQYLDLLAREMDLWLDRLGLDRFRAESVLVAGGTPTHLSPRLFRRFHEDFARRVDLSGCTQLSYDVYPNTLLGAAGRERLAIMRDYGSDRLTLGVQSMDDAQVLAMRRTHTGDATARAVEACREAGFSDVCVEYIYGLPDQSVETWLDTLRAAIALDPEEIQLYRLKIVPYGDARGPVERLWTRQPERFPSVEEQVTMKQAALLLLREHGYEQNLTRVFTRERRHTSHYATDQCCRLLDCVGFGLSAFSSLHDRFCINPDTLAGWSEPIRQGRLPLDRGIVRDRDPQLRWHMVLPLKNDEVRKGAYLLRTGERADLVWRRELDLLALHGLVREDERRIRLTELGRFFADEVCLQLQHPRHMPFPREDYAPGPLYLSRPLDPG